MTNIGTSPLPQENLPPLGRSGDDYGWPRGMLPASAVEVLRGEGLTKTSQVFLLARCMTQEQWRNFLEGTHHGAADPRPQHDHLLAWLSRPEILEDFRLRVPGRPSECQCEWTGGECLIITSHLRAYMNIREALPDGMPQNERIARAIAANQLRYSLWRAEHGRALER